MAAAPPVPLLPRLTSLSVSDHSWTTQQSGLTLLTRQSPAPCLVLLMSFPITPVYKQ